MKIMEEPRKLNQCLCIKSGSLTWRDHWLRRPLDVSDEEFFSFFIVTAKCNENKKFDKDIATAINMGLNTDEDLKDECAGWHVIVGKSFASAITYQTKYVLFFDLLGDVHKTFLIFKTQ